MSITDQKKIYKKRKKKKEKRKKERRKKKEERRKKKRVGPSVVQRTIWQISDSDPIILQAQDRKQSM